MKSKSKLVILSFVAVNVLSCMLSQPAFAGNQEDVQDFTKTIKKEYSINSTGTVALSNRYGKVDVKAWKNNRVKIDVTIIVKANSESAAQKVFDRIRIDFANNDSYVKAETTVESSNSSWFSWGSSSRSEFQINYEVFMPETASLELSNRYGNSTADAISGKATVSIKYGDVRLNGIGGPLTFELGYGNGTILKASSVQADISYSRVTFNQAQDFSAVTKYSKVYLDNAKDARVESSYDQLGLSKLGKLKLTAKYGNVEIAEISNIAVAAKYTDFKIERLFNRADFDLQYGGLSVLKLAKGFEYMNLVGKYTSYKIGIEPGANYSVDAVANYAGISYPPALQVSYEKDKGTSKEVRGQTSGSGTRGSIKATVEYGGLKLF
jgi:hypothetical protein